MYNKCGNFNTNGYMCMVLHTMPFSLHQNLLCAHGHDFFFLFLLGAVGIKGKLFILSLPFPLKWVLLKRPHDNTLGSQGFQLSTYTSLRTLRMCMCVCKLVLFERESERERLPPHFFVEDTLTTISMLPSPIFLPFS